MFRNATRINKDTISPLTELSSCIERIEAFISKVSYPSHRKRRGSPPRPRHINGLSVSEGQQRADFVTIGSQKDEDEFIEILRRIAELVVLGEQRTAQLSEANDSDETMDIQEREALALLDLFYERNALDLIVGIITGDQFRERISKKDSSLSLSSVSTDELIFLPPISIAIQAVQTVSILIQNVARSTSLYLLLSNNRLGSLIDLSLELYLAASKKLPEKLANEQVAEFLELNTHFISLLKSMALRINAETLQFFIIYPDSVRDNQNQSFQPPIEFPLYAKSLSFCSSHHDSFVRITAFNICMNLLRASSKYDSSSVAKAGNLNTKSASHTDGNTINDTVPNAGTLCNLPAISFRDRQGIMKYICSPKRVRELVSSIFLNVATISTALEESIRALHLIDISLEISQADIGANKNESENYQYEVAWKERSECVRAIRNSAADLEDELLLLNDILKVGLICLNEQIVELVLTTIVYPQLLQPLHSWLQYELESPGKSTTTPVATPAVSEQDHIMLSQATTALFVAMILFRSISHKPSLHVIFVALCYPMMPHESKSYIVTRSFSPDEFMSYEDESVAYYDFILDQGVDRPSTGTESTSVESEDAVFILSPALFFLFRSAEYHLQSECIETKPNPYRSALLLSISLSKKFPLHSKVAVYLLDAIIVRLSTSVINNIFPLQDEVEGIMISLFSNLITESISPTGFATLDFDLIVAHAILYVSPLNQTAHSASERLVTTEYSKSLSFLSHLPHFIAEYIPSINGQKYVSKSSSSDVYGAIIFSLFYGTSNGLFKCVVESLLSNRSRLESTEQAIFITIANDNANGELSSVFADESRFKATQSKMSVLAASVDSILAIMKVATLKRVIQYGAAVNCQKVLSIETTTYSLKDSHHHPILSNSNFSSGGDFLSPLPTTLRDIIICAGMNLVDDPPLPVTGSVISFAGKIAFPCVCEIATEFSPLIVDQASCIIADGIRWLSLYLVISANAMILAEPLAEGTNENGRVLSSCRIQNLQVTEDNPIEVQNASPARRLVFTHTCYSCLVGSIPELFTEIIGGTSPLGKSTIDLWFENLKAAQLALYIVTSKIERLRALLGLNLFETIISHRLDTETEHAEMIAVTEDASSVDNGGDSNEEKNDFSGERKDSITTEKDDSEPT